LSHCPLVPSQGWAKEEPGDQPFSSIIMDLRLVIESILPIVGFGVRINPTKE
jgi:hypothetical protein